MEQANQEKKRRRWTCEETHGFLRCYIARKEEFQHPKKKRLAFTNVLEDMLPFGITDSERTPLCLESKMRTLLQAYKAARDNNRSTGASPCFAPFMEQMDEIFGRSPIISNSRTIHLSSRAKTTLLPTTLPPLTPSPPTPSPLTPSPPSPSTPSPLTPSPSTPSPSTPSPLTPSPPTPSPLTPSPPLPSPPTPSPLSPPTPSPLPTPAASVRKRRSAREVYYSKKLEIRKWQAQEKLRLKAESLQQFNTLLKAKFERDAEMEKKRLDLLEKIANK